MDRFGSLERDAILKVLDSGNLSGYYRNFRGGEKVQAFEENFAKYHGRKHGIAVNSGTSALHVAMLACQVKDCRVLTTPFSFVASASCIPMAGGIVRFSDVDPKTFCIDPKPEEARECRAIIGVHILGHPFDGRKLLDAKFYKGERYLVEDCAQALGAIWNGNLVGTMGDLACFSFNHTKTLSTGEGGMILTDDDDLALRCRRLINHGEKYDYGPDIGYNFRLTEMQAALGLAQLRWLDDLLKETRENARIVLDELPEEFERPYVAPNVVHSWFIVATRWKGDREKLIQRLTVEGISKNLPGQTVGTGYKELIHQLPYYKSQGWSLPNAEAALKDAIWFDIHRFCGQDQVKWRVAQVRKIVKEMA